MANEKADGDFSIEAYREFLRAKCNLPQELGIPIEPGDLPMKFCSGPGMVDIFELKPHQAAGIIWGAKGGRRALFESFGLGKTVQQLLILWLILKAKGGRALIVAPLGVRQEFMRDAQRVGIELKFIRRIEEADETGIYLTNYETACVRLFESTACRRRRFKAYLPDSDTRGHGGNWTRTGLSAARETG